MRVSWEFKGLSELQQSLRLVPAEIRDQCLREGLRRAGDALADGMARRAPVAAVHRVVRQGREYPIPLREAMRRRVKVGPYESAVDVGPARIAFWGMFQELGTRYQTGRRFMQQTLEQDGQTAVAALATGCRDKFDAAMRRANRQAV